MKRSKLFICCRYWQGFVVDPSQNFYYRWLFVISISVLYNVVFIIARSVFLELQRSYLLMWLALDYLSDTLYIIDMFISFKTGKRRRQYSLGGIRD